jgi:general secretion pathway protein C
MAFDQLLKRNFWVVIGLLVALAAFLHAQGITQLVGASLGATEEQLAAAPPAPKAATSAAAPPFHATSAEAVLARNPFDSVKGPLNPLPPEEAEASGPDLSDPLNAPVCDGVKLLVITASSDPEWSFAAFSVDNKSVLRRRGGDVSGKMIHFIGWDRVWLTSGPSLCQAQLFKPPPPPPAAPGAAPAPAAAAPSGPGLDPAIAKGISKVSGTEFNIDRGVVDKILENQADLMRQARIVPEQENGKLVGIRLFGVRPDTLLGVLGMENGDRLQTINGFDMTSPEKALEAYARLRTADHLTVQVNRRGSNMNLDFNIK